MLLCFNLGIQLLTHIGRSRALSDYKEGKGNINNKIYKISSGTTEEEVQSKIYKRGNRYMGEGAHIEPEIVVAIRKVENSKEQSTTYLQKLETSLPIKY